MAFSDSSVGDQTCTGSDSTPTPITELSLGHLLLVDDNELCLFVLGQIMERAGYRVTLSSNPERTIGHDMRNFDLAIVDFDMPGCDGQALLQRMRAADATFPVILHSGSADLLPIETKILFSSCISKPTRTQDLLATVAHFLGNEPVQNSLVTLGKGPSGPLPS
jgi:DNA-binding NtrC family response regulator